MPGEKQQVILFNARTFPRMAAPATACSPAVVNVTAGVSYPCQLNGDACERIRLDG